MIWETMIFYSYCTFKEILRRDDFHPRVKHLYENFCPGFKQAETRLAPGRDEKCPDFIKAYITNLWRNECILLISFIIPSRFLSRPGSYINNSLAKTCRSKICKYRPFLFISPLIIRQLCVSILWFEYFLNNSLVLYLIVFGLD